MTCVDFGRFEIRTEVDASFSPFRHSTEVDRSWSQIICIFVKFTIICVSWPVDLRIRWASHRKSVRKIWFCKLAWTFMDRESSWAAALVFNLRFAVWPRKVRWRAWIVRIYEDLRWRWSISNSYGSRQKFFTVSPPKGSRHKRWSQVSCICLKFTFATCVSLRELSIIRFWFQSVKNGTSDGVLRKWRASHNLAKLFINKRSISYFSQQNLKYLTARRM